MGTLLLVGFAALGLLTVQRSISTRALSSLPQSELQRAYEVAKKTFPFSGSSDAARKGWVESGNRDAMVKRFAAAVAAVAPSEGYPGAWVPAFITAHAAWSSGWGRSVMTRLIHNYFGIKPGSSWKGAVLLTPPTSHDVDKNLQKYRVYNSLEDCARDYFRILSASRYTKSREALRTGNLFYGGQLGADGWYGGQTPEAGNATWRDFLSKVTTILKSP